MSEKIDPVEKLYILSARPDFSLVQFRNHVTRMCEAEAKRAAKASREQLLDDLEKFIVTPFRRKVTYRNVPTLAFDDGANDVKYYIRKWMNERRENKQ